MSATIEFGFMARPIGQQFPCLPEEVATALDADSKAMSRLAVRGYLPPSQKSAVAKKIAAEASKAIAKASEHKTQLPQPNVRPYPDLLSGDEGKEILSDAEGLWRALQANNLGGFSGHNRPFYILHAFKQVIEKYGKRDVGLTWSKDALDAAAPPPQPRTEPAPSQA